MNMKRWATAFLCFYAIGQSFGQQLEVAEDPTKPKYGQIAISGLSKTLLEELKAEELTFRDWSSFYKVRVKDASRNVAGKYLLRDSTIVFEPRFIPDSEVVYRISFLHSKLNQIIGLDHIGEDYSWNYQFKSIGEKGSVIGLQPMVQKWPENILRIYIHFTSPMGLANPHEFITLREIGGPIVEEPFVEVKEGLWNSDRTRLTLFFHPGRIKRNVGPNESIGSALQNGKAYEISIDASWETASGGFLKEGFVRQFLAGPAIREAVSISGWRIEMPQVNTLKELIIHTNELMDEALVSRMLSIELDGKAVKGDFQLSGTSKVVFKPLEAWELLDYALLIDEKFEDVCGNTIHHPFDIEGSSVGEDQKVGKIYFKPVR